jgi:hypothetical protein
MENTLLSLAIVKNVKLKLEAPSRKLDFQNNPQELLGTHYVPVISWCDVQTYKGLTHMHTDQRVSHKAYPL